MEYITAGKADVTLRQASFAPCGTNPYPAACARYLVPRMLDHELESTGSTRRVLDLCTSMAPGPVRLGCIHGLGNAFMPWVAGRGLQIAELCSKFVADENRVCIEGVIERLARYDPERATQVCSELAGGEKGVCDEAARNQMYSMDKDFELYLDAKPVR